jgi:hypothetical protein
MTTMSHWTPVAEQMPPEGRYLVVRQIGEHRYIDIAPYSPEPHFGLKPLGWFDQATHWMALPTMPEPQPPEP